MIFKKKNNDNNNKDLVKIAALLVHAAKIDENFSQNEEKVIKKAIQEFGANVHNVENILEEGKKLEKNSNQILDFTREAKNMNENDKIRLVEILWQIIYSNNEADMYEANLMRRLAGLLYIDSKIMGDIKNKIREENL